MKPTNFLILYFQPLEKEQKKKTNEVSAICITEINTEIWEYIILFVGFRDKNRLRHGEDLLECDYMYF
jgi:hypothetical protein